MAEGVFAPLLSERKLTFSPAPLNVFLGSLLPICFPRERGGIMVERRTLNREVLVDPHKRHYVVSLSKKH